MRSNNESYKKVCDSNLSIKSFKKIQVYELFIGGKMSLQKQRKNKLNVDKFI